MTKHEHNGCANENMIEARYANVFTIGYNAFEFVFEFGQRYEDSEEECHHIRIVTCPKYAKALLQTLQKSIEAHEKTFGKIAEKQMG